jgi:hypothetical protein
MTIAELTREYVHYYRILLTEEARIGFKWWLKANKPDVWPLFELALREAKVA